ncbi:MAG: ABC-F family ATP-binding cassette domain-containing protein [Lachnospiraceae bacterium]|nr:ABC-F family ATP-binding cassette domain-containing protein [Lachnospiraceae bacterium]
MLQLKNITIHLKEDGRYITDNFSFTLNRGDKAVIIGEEGNGKSTLLKFIYQQNLIENYCVCSGDIITKGKMAYLPQVMDKSCDTLSLAEYFESSEYYMHTDILTKLGLSIDFILSDQKLVTLSGGEKVKIQLAHLLMEEPDILLLDEPTNDLDIPTLQWLETFIAESRLPVLYISHDETLIENTANTIVHMEQIIRKSKCRISVSHCSYREYLSHRKISFTHQEQVAKKQREDYEKQMEKWRKIYDRVNHEQGAITRQDPHGGKLLKKKMSSVISMGKRFEKEKENFLDFPQEEEAILAKFDETIHLPSGKTVLDFSCDKLCIGERILSQNLQLYVSGSEHIGIIGRNGAGKSTLLSLLWNNLKDRNDITAAFMPQNYAEILDFNKTPVQYLAESYTKQEVTKARTYMGGMKFTHEEMTGKIGNLSGGQRAKILFLDMVLRGADVLVLDEPTRNFSPLSSPVVRAALYNFGGAIISVSHDRKYLNEVCNKIYELCENGLFPVDKESEYL